MLIPLLHISPDFTAFQAMAAAGAAKSDGPRPVRATKEPNRNDPCPCGSGKKYKVCCGFGGK